MDKWEELKKWVADRHDHFEASYKKTNFAADAAELGAYRSVFTVMSDLERRSARELASQETPTPRRKR